MNNIVNSVNKDMQIIACKKRAKEILKNQSNQENLTLMQCLDLAAKEMSFNSWYELRKNVKNKIINKNNDHVGNWESLIYEYFKQGYETIHFEIRKSTVEMKGRKFGLIDNINHDISQKGIKEVLKKLNINPTSYDWLSKEMYNIQTMPVYDRNNIQDSYDIVVVKKDSFDLQELRNNSIKTAKPNISSAKLKFNENLALLGFSKSNIQDINFRFENKNIFIAGITGSGKTKTAKVLIEELRARNLKVAEIEEFIHEEDLDKTILSYMKLSPDYFYIPEVRSGKTATWLNKLIQTGHNIITTVHAASIDGIYPRMKMLEFSEFDNEYYVPNSLFIYQELNRTLCSHCKEKEFSFQKIMKDSGFMSYVKKHERYEDAEHNIHKLGDYNQCKDKNCHHGYNGIKLNAETFNMYHENEDERAIKYMRYHVMTKEEKNLTDTIQRFKQGKVKDYLKMLSQDRDSNKYERILKGECEL